MQPTPLLPGCYLLDLGSVNAYLLDHEGLTLIDTGNPGDAPRILSALKSLGYAPTDLQAMILTHHHPDHCGAAAALQEATGARVYMHRDDAEALASGLSKRTSLAPAPGLLNRLLFRFLLARAQTQVEPCTADQWISDGEELPLNGGLKVIHTPGHTEGHVSLLWEQQGGVMFVADAAIHVPKLRVHPGYEVFQTGRQSLRRLAAESFQVATFGHGRPIMQRGGQVFARAFGA